MKIKMLLLMTILLLVIVAAVRAQAPHSCGTISSMSVVYDRVDASGYAPRFKEGSQDQFNCIAARDPNFSTLRFPSAWQATNYWYGLLGAEMGVILQPLPAPTN